MKFLPYLAPTLATLCGVATIANPSEPAAPTERAALADSMGCQSWPLEVLKDMAATRKAVAL